MARNGVQFQKGLSEPAFEQQYGTEEQCRAIVVAARWPRGFECPACGGKQYSLVTTRNLYQCTKCRRQTSADCGDDLCLDASAAAAMVSRDLSPDPDQARHFQHRTGPSPWGDADHRLEGQTQVEAGHA